MWRTSNLNNRTKLNVFKPLNFLEKKNLDQNGRELDSFPSYQIYTKPWSKETSGFT